MSVADAILLIDTLAWPIVALLVLIVARRPILDLVGRAKSVDVRGVKFELQDRLNAARASAENADMTILFSTKQLVAARSHLASDEATVFATDPSLAVPGELVATERPGLFLASVFDDLSKDVRRVAKVIRGTSVSYNEAIKILSSREILTENMLGVISSLREARNLAVHEDEETITPAEAADWSGIVFGLRQRIDQRARMLLDSSLVSQLDGENKKDVGPTSWIFED
ncbi:MAG: hypothetical protein AAGH17_01600 [Pseudomonadota bacterium]